MKDPMNEVRAAACALAQLVVLTNEHHPGEPDACVELSPQEWNEMLAAAKRVLVAEEACGKQVGKPSGTTPAPAKARFERPKR